jgi:hypothetical protein
MPCRNNTGMKYAQTETFEHTISGLLTKRAELLGEAVSLRDRMATINNDVSAIDRVLTGTLGHTGDLDAQMPRQKRQVLFGRGDLFRSIMDVLREAKSPMTSRQIAQEITSLGGLDARDRKFVSDLTKRVGKSLRQTGAASKGTDAWGNVVWTRAA